MSYVKCEHAIGEPSDLNLKKVKIYILGNSLSKQRQGLNRLREEKVLSSYSETVFNKTVPFIDSNGYDSWLFTKSKWEKYQANPEFPLINEGQYIIEERKLY